MMKNLELFSNLHLNKSILVCGCGESLNDLARPESFITIGVNDVGRRFQPNYLVVVNPRNQFSGDRFEFVENSQAEYLFTQLDLGVRHPNIVKFKLGSFGGTNFSDKNVLHYTNNSPYIALCLAILMGAKRIGLIGVDFTDNHFFARTGRHPLAPQFDSINEQYCRLADAAKSHGTEIFNLSQISRLTAFPQLSVEAFAAFSAPPPEIVEKRESLNIVSYATTPVAGVPAILARCINAQTENSARCVWATNSYGNGVEFAGDVEWQKQPQMAEDLLAEADLVIVHNGKVAPRHERFFSGKPVVTMAHNYLWNVDERFVGQGFAGVVVGQYQAALDEFRDWSVVPNPIPFWENEYQPLAKNSELTICYTPSGKHEKYPLDHKLYWHSKGYETTMRILEKLSSRFSLKLEVIGGEQISHAESLLMKRRSHIVIDECVTGSYHRNSLEGLAGGAVVVNGLGILPKVENILRYCAGERAEIPFVSATLENLEEVLTCLLESGRENLIEKGAKNRTWLENHWNFSRQWEKFWIPAIEKSFAEVNRKTVPAKPENINPANRENINPNIGGSTAEKGGFNVKELKDGISIVISHGGKYRLPHLRACLANLRQCAGVGEIIVAEMDETPLAAEIARRWADKYIFIPRSGAFEKGRALNLGSLFAEYEFVLWLDNDLLMEPDFFTKALAEMRSKQLDYLKPYSETYYLNFADSELVMQGVLNPETCQPVQIDRTFPCGRAEIMRNDFLKRFGGIPDGFQGWGGEDNAWAHKANLFGKCGTMEHGKQKLFHLFHLLSGGYSGGLQIAANRHYRANVDLLNKVYAVRDREQFMETFPPRKYAPWESSKKIVFVAGKTEESAAAAARLTAENFEELFAVAPEIVAAGDGAAEKTAELLREKQPDAIVFFDPALYAKISSEKLFDEFLEKTVLIAGQDFDLKEIQLRPVVILPENKRVEVGFNNPNVWFRENETADEAEFRALPLTLTQPLSLILGQPQADAAKKSAKPEPAKNGLPIWFYWEGARPAWIEACHQTIVAKNPGARFITPETFAEIWTEDRDIDIAPLYVAHRADFIRCYLLAHFGGLWIDADCLVVQGLQFLLDKLDEYDFLAHRERNGLFTNDLLGARRESVIAKQFYEQICRTLRRTRAITWREIGGDPLTEILHNTEARFFEIPCQSIQPVCWSQPEKFFARASDSQHAANFDENAVCYMLSNGAVNTYMSKNPKADLTAGDTFFNYVIRRALNEHPSGKLDDSAPTEEASQSENRLKSLSFYLEMIARIAPRKILDADVGSGRWAVLLRDFFESSNGAKQLKIEAVVDNKLKKNEFLDSIYDRVKTGKLKDLLQSAEEKNDLLILGDYLTRNGNFPNTEILQTALDKADYALLNFRQPKNDFQPSDSERNLLRFLGANSVKIAAIQKNENIVSVLLSQNDPKNICPASNFAEAFQDMTEVFARQSEESLAGPGCSLGATAKIRRSLPLLFSSLGINSLLDARCGDFNWLRRVDLRLEKYIGVDVAASLVEQNRKLYENERRKFMVADVRRDFLPETDLILCRDLLVHLSFEDIFSALRNFCGSGAKYLLSTTFTNKHTNADIITGNWRTLNLQLPPFNFPAPFKLLNEGFLTGGEAVADKSLGLWLISDIYKILD